VTQPPCFLFDECVIGPVIVEQDLTASLALFGAEAELTHLFQKFSPGTLDSIWISQIAAEGGWIVVTSDRGAKSKKSERLPLICRELRVTHVVLSRGLHKRSAYFRTLANSSSWRQLLDAAEAAKGTGFSLSMSTAKKEVISFRFQKLYDPPGDELPPELPQGEKL
jgi:hypothetical protein